jgi:hypothetical protein
MITRLQERRRPARMTKRLPPSPGSWRQHTNAQHRRDSVVILHTHGLCHIMCTHNMTIPKRFLQILLRIQRPGPAVTPPSLRALV